MFTLPPASVSLQRSPRPRPAAATPTGTQPRRPGCGAAAGSPHRKTRRAAATAGPLRPFLLRMRVPALQLHKGHDRRRQTKPAEQRRTVVAEGLAPEAELGDKHKRQSPTGRLTSALTMLPSRWVADRGKGPPFFLACISPVVPGRASSGRWDRKKPRVRVHPPPTSPLSNTAQGTAATQLQLSVAGE